MNDLTNKIALVTGATSGIGEACAIQFAKAGAVVVATGRNEEKGSEIIEKIKKNGGQAEFLSMDVMNDDSIAAVAKHIDEKYHGLDILLNNAGAYPMFSGITEIEREDVDAVFALNSSSLVMVTKYMFPLLEKKGGVILNNASIAGIQSFASGQGYAYAASKSAVIQFTRMLAKNYANQIRVNCICPGVIKTPLYRTFNEERFAERIPQKRVGLPEDIATVANFLVSDDAQYINGAVVPIDGGLTL